MCARSFEAVGVPVVLSIHDVHVSPSDSLGCDFLGLMTWLACMES
jgi:hypothetical protein